MADTDWLLQSLHTLAGGGVTATKFAQEIAAELIALRNVEDAARAFLKDVAWGQWHALRAALDVLDREE